MHALRHYYASFTLADGVNIKELNEYLGHHDPDPGSGSAPQATTGDRASR
jgi:integrase